MKKIIIAAAALLVVVAFQFCSKTTAVSNDTTTVATGITPALSDKAAALTEAALKIAKAKGITTSIDLNFRKKLWSKDKARAVMSKALSVCRCLYWQ